VTSQNHKQNYIPSLKSEDGRNTAAPWHFFRDRLGTSDDAKAIAGASGCSNKVIGARTLAIASMDTVALSVDDAWHDTHMIMGNFIQNADIHGTTHAPTLHHLGAVTETAFSLTGSFGDR
jgi:hypothetical protein